MTNASLRLAASTALVLLLAGLAPTATAHGAAPALEHQTRLLADYNDDWFGVQDGHNQIALDGYTQSNASLGGDVLVLRFILDGGWTPTSSQPELSEHVTFKANGQDIELALKTADNLAFEPELGFTAVRGPFPQLTVAGEPDGERFYVEGLVPFADLGLQAGDALTDFFVTGEAGDAEADLMPQGQAAGLPETCGGPLACIGFNVGTYVLPDPSVHVGVLSVTPATLAVPAEGEATLTIGLANPYNASAQTFTVTAGGSGVLLNFTAPAAGNTASATLDLQGGANGTLLLHVARAPAIPAATDTGNATNVTNGTASHGHGMHPSGGSAPLTLELDIQSSLGGHKVLRITGTVAQPVVTVVDRNTTDHDHHDHDDAGEDTPALALPLLVAAMVAIAIVRRR